MEPGRETLAPAGVDACEVEGENLMVGDRPLSDAVDLVTEAESRGLTTDLPDLTRC